jgi:hypothetical protein
MDDNDIKVENLHISKKHIIIFPLFIHKHESQRPFYRLS